MVPSKAAGGQAAFFEAFTRAAGTQIVATELLFEQLVAVHHPYAAFHLCFRRETASPLAHHLKRTPVRRNYGTAWDTSPSFAAGRDLQNTHPERVGRTQQMWDGFTRNPWTGQSSALHSSNGQCPVHRVCPDFASLASHGCNVFARLTLPRDAICDAMNPMRQRLRHAALRWNDLTNPPT